MPLAPGCVGTAEDCFDDVLFAFELSRTRRNRLRGATGAVLDSCLTAGGRGVRFYLVHFASCQSLSPLVPPRARPRPPFIHQQVRMDGLRRVSPCKDEKRKPFLPSVQLQLNGCWVVSR